MSLEISFVFPHVPTSLFFLFLFLRVIQVFIPKMMLPLKWVFFLLICNVQKLSPVCICLHWYCFLVVFISALHFSTFCYLTCHLMLLPVFVQLCFFLSHRSSISSKFQTVDHSGLGLGDSIFLSVIIYALLIDLNNICFPVTCISGRALCFEIYCKFITNSFQHGMASQTEHF